MSPPNLQELLSPDVVLDLLKIPAGGLLKISAALLFLGHDELFAFYWRERDGTQRCKFVAADAVMQAFNPMPFDSGWMPAGTLRLGINAKGQRWLMIYVPPGRHQLSIVDNDLGLQIIDVPLPGFIFTGCGHNYWIWATKETQITARTELYHAPLSNVSGNGGICFGSNRSPEASGATILQALHLFLASPFNGHMAHSKSHKHQGDIRYLLTELAAQGGQLFPSEELVPITGRDRPGRALTLETLLNSVIPRR